MAESFNGLLATTSQWAFDEVLATLPSTSQKALTQLIQRNERFSHNQVKHSHQFHEQLVILSDD